MIISRCLQPGVPLLLCLFSIGNLRAQIPADSLLQSLRPSADVNDYANILTPTQKGALEARCKTLREKNGAQLAVVIVRSLEGGQIDDFANKLFARWGIGEKGKDNGILLLVAMQDHKARVEVGYGLEPILPDALAGRVLDQQLFPAFKQQRYFDGLSGAVNRICDIVEKDQPATAADRRGAGEMGFKDRILMAGFLGVFVAIGTFVAGTGVRSRLFLPILFGLFFAGIPIFMGFLMAAPVAPVMHIPIGLLMGFLGWRAGTGTSRRTGGWTSSYPASTWTSNSWGTSDWSSGGGGGFSSDWGGFGGGSSGGGGASGGW